MGYIVNNCSLLRLAWNLLPRHLLKSFPTTFFFFLIIVTYISTIFKWFAVCLLKWFICTKIQSMFICNNDHFLPTFNCLTSSTLFSKLSVISSYEYFPQSHCSYIHLVEYDGANNSGKTSQSYAQTLWIID